MTQSSILGGERAARRSAGKDVDVLGPSDTSDSGSDVQGERAMATDGDSPDELGSLATGTDNDSDSSGTGERASATGRDGIDGADIGPDRVLESIADESDDALDRAEAVGDMDDLAVEDDSDEDDANDAGASR